MKQRTDEQTKEKEEKNQLEPTHKQQNVPLFTICCPKDQCDAKRKANERTEKHEKEKTNNKMKLFFLALKHSGGDNRPEKK